LSFFYFNTLFIKNFRNTTFYLKINLVHDLIADFSAFLKKKADMTAGSA